MTDIHSCSYYCDRPECIRRQRDELREHMSALAKFADVLDCSQTTQALIRMLIERDQRERAKYGTTVDHPDLSRWMSPEYTINDWLSDVAPTLLAGYALAEMRTAG